LAAEVKAALVNEFPNSGVTAINGVVVVKIELPLSQQKKATNAIKDCRKHIWC
jgi:hypothetical protein